MNQLIRGGTVQIDDRILSDIQSEVLGYLEEHPSGSDTAEGIRQWWLFQRMAKYSQHNVQKALDQLTAARLIDVQLLENGKEVFRLSQSYIDRLSQ